MDAQELAAQVDLLTRRISELEQEVLTHREAAAELRRIQADLSRAQRLAKIGNWRWSVLRQELIDGSDMYAEIHGADQFEIHELMKDFFERVIYSEDRERVEKASKEADTSGTEFQDEYRIVRPDGEIRHVREIGENIFDESGRIVEQVGTVQDITELKFAEEALRQSHEELERRVWVRTAELQNANAKLREEVEERTRAEALRREHELLLRSAARISKMGYAVWDELEQNYAKVSEEFAALQGLTVEEFNRRYPTYDEDFQIIHPEDREHYRTFDDAYRANPTDSQIEYRIIDPKGDVIYVRELMQPVQDENGRLVQSIITLQNITTEKRIEEQLRQSQKMEAVGQLTGGIAHDFNNLLAVIVGNLELVESRITQNTTDSASIQAALDAAARGGDLTQRLLAFSRKQELRPEIVDANALVQRILNLLRRTIGESIDIELDADPDLWQCFVDPNQLENAILNLAINARDAISGGGTITISILNTRIDADRAQVYTEATPGEYVLLAVSDTGRGIPANARERIFEPFYTTKDIGRGSGLGLSMVYGFITQSGGHVNVESEEGNGTTVQLFLPKALESSKPKGARASERDVPSASGETVLVVEDDSDLRKLVVRMLDSLGYTTIEADSGARALEIIESPTELDVLLTDVVLPKQMSGSELVDAALRERPDLAVIYMSGYTEESITQDGQTAVDVEFLQKPFRIGEVARATRKALAGKKPANDE